MAHIGQNIAKLRGIRRMTQKEMASKTGLFQPEYSKLEQKEEIDDDLLAIIAAALDVTPEAIRKFNEEAVINIVSNILNDNSAIISNYPIINLNPIDKLIEVIEENKKLYERLLQEKDEKIELYKKQLKG
jgi:transcriptional regulator with XRE-family HTH domain